MKRVLISCVVSISLLAVGAADLRAETKPQSQCPPLAEGKDDATPKCDQAFQPKGGLAWMTESAEFKALAEATFIAAGNRLEEIAKQHKSTALP
jgi:hypothetical protein